jgi:hypothetical protein
MSAHPLFRSLLPAAALLVAACASAPGTLLDRKFQRAAATYEKYDVHGQAVYCKKGYPSTFDQLPGLQCLNEAQLRRQVEDFERSRETRIGRPVPAGAGQGSVGG